MTRADLALKTGFLTQYVGTTERGDRLPNIRNLRRFADALNVAPSMFLEGSLRKSDVKNSRIATWDTETVLCERVIQIRTAKGLTRQQVAMRAGLDINHLWRMENGKMIFTLPTLIAICKALGIKASEVID